MKSVLKAIVLAVVTASLLAGCGGSDAMTLTEVACSSASDSQDVKDCPGWASQCAAVSDAKRQTFECVQAIIARNDKERNDEFNAQKDAELDEFSNELTHDNFDRKCGDFLGDNPPTEGMAPAYIDACELFASDY